jgi:TonB-dependent SusC/RagA subfamily outer membrane receptor
MKYRSALIVVLLVLIATACGSERGTVSSSSQDPARAARPGEPILERIRRVPGVNVLHNGEIRLRGSTQAPLIVVDSIPSRGSDLGFLNAEDVDRIEVLHGSRASRYGVDGANGVILITTRSGPRAAGQ